MALRGPYALYSDCVNASLALSWILNPNERCPSSSSGNVQRSIYNVFKTFETCEDFPKELAQKVSVTLGPNLASTFQVPVNWVLLLTHCLVHVKQHVAFCVFETLIGGWTTSHRMHEPQRLPCIFGCHGEQDLQLHYLLCAPLWHICSSAFGADPPYGFLALELV